MGRGARLRALPRAAPSLYRWRAMRSASRCLLALAWLCQAGPLLAAAEAAGGRLAHPIISPALEPPVRLVAPGEEAALVGGSQAALAWEPLAPLDRLGPIEEWEAFLSLDGGRHYTIRITPHLSRTLHSFAWSVPAIASADARILLRFGDERRERTWPLGQRFRIVAAPGGELIPAVTAFAPGEAPLPGEAGVVAWAEGTRQGAALRQVAYRAPPTMSGLDLPALSRVAALVATQATTAPAAPPRRQVAEAEPDAPAPPADAQAAPPPPVEPLLMTQRRNE
jgi:hypothetical protein